MKTSALVLVAALIAAFAPSAQAQQVASAAEGVLIRNVVANSAAAQIGLQAGDRIVAIDGAPTVDAFDMAWAIGSHEPGSRLNLQVVRGGKAIQLEGTLGRRVSSGFVRPAALRTPVQAPVYQFTPADINDQRAYGG